MLCSVDLRKPLVESRHSPSEATIALHKSDMRFALLGLLLSGCAGVSFAPSLGFYGSWHGPRTITFSGSEYDMNGSKGHYGSDANVIYFTEQSLPPARKNATIPCPYTLVGDTLILRDCPLAGEYRRG